MGLYAKLYKRIPSVLYLICSNIKTNNYFWSSSKKIIQKNGKYQKKKKMKKHVSLLLLASFLLSSGKIFAQTITYRQIIGKWEATDISLKAKKSAALNRIFSMPAMQMAMKRSMDGFSFHFIDENTVENFSKFGRRGKEPKRYQIIEQNNNTTFIYIQNTNKEEEEVSADSLYEVTSFNNDEIVLRIRKKLADTGLMSTFKMLLQTGEKIESDEELLTDIHLKKLHEAPWKQLLSITDVSAQDIKFTRNDKQLMIWYNKALFNEETGVSKFILVMLKSTDRGLHWNKKEVSLDSTEEFVSNLSITSAGVFYTTPYGYYSLAEFDVNPSRISSSNLPKDLASMMNDGGILIGRNDTLLQMKQKSIWMSVNAGKSWEATNDKKLDENSEYTYLNIGPHGERITETTQLNPKTGESKKLMTLHSIDGKKIGNIALPEKKKATSANANDHNFELAGFDEGLNPFFDISGNLYLHHQGKIIKTSDLGKTYQDAEIPECKNEDKQTKDSPETDNANPLMQLMMGGLNNASGTMFLFGNSYKVCNTACGIWYKKADSGNWTLANHSALNEIEAKQMFLADDMIIAMGTDQKLYALALTDK